MLGGVSVLGQLEVLLDKGIMDGLQLGMDGGSVLDLGDSYAAQHKEELDIFNKAVRTLMKLNGSIAVDFSALDAEFSALQSSSAEFRTQLETLQPDISDLKSVRKYIDMVLNKQQLFAPGGKTPEKESVLKKLEQFQQKKSHHKTTSTPPNREESL